MLAANSNQGVASLSASQSMRNGTVVGGDVKNVSPRVTRNAPRPLSLTGTHHNVVVGAVRPRAQRPIPTIVLRLVCPMVMTF